MIRLSLFALTALLLLPLRPAQSESNRCEPPLYSCRDYVSQISAEESPENMTKFRQLFGPAANVHAALIKVYSGVYKVFSGFRKLQLGSTFLSLDSIPLSRHTAIAYTYHLDDLLVSVDRQFVQDLVRHGCLGAAAYDEDQGVWRTLDILHAQATYQARNLVLLSDEPLPHIGPSETIVSWRALVTFPNGGNQKLETAWLSPAASEREVRKWRLSKINQCLPDVSGWE